MRLHPLAETFPLMEGQEGLAGVRKIARGELTGAA
jgi:hypothetical protein